MTTMSIIRAGDLGYVPIGSHAPRSHARDISGHTWFTDCKVDEVRSLPSKAPSSLGGIIVSVYE